VSEAGPQPVEEARLLLDALDEGAEIDAARVARWVAQLQAEAASLSKPDLAFCVEVLGAVQEQVRLQLVTLDGELAKLQLRRRGMRGYAHLRSQKVQQRLNKRA
jgi:hypothetical protein